MRKTILTEEQHARVREIEKNCYARHKPARQASAKARNGVKGETLAAAQKRLRDIHNKIHDAGAVVSPALTTELTNATTALIEAQSRKYGPGYLGANGKAKKRQGEWRRNNPVHLLVIGALLRGWKRAHPGETRHRGGWGEQAASLVESLRPFPKVCPVFGMLLEYGERGLGSNRPNAATLDQIVPGGGYVVGNVAIISRRANLIKNSGTAAEHRAIAEWMDWRELW